MYIHHDILFIIIGRTILDFPYGHVTKYIGCKSLKNIRFRFFLFKNPHQL